ncbi:MAG: hypothetical protein ACN4GW_20655 [Desulforhopalus sp.]
MGVVAWKRPFTENGWYDKGLDRISGRDHIGIRSCRDISPGVGVSGM